MTMAKRIQRVSPLLEFLVGSGLGIFFHQVLHFEEAAYITFGIGLLLSLATYLLREELGEVRHRLLAQYENAHELTFAVAQIADPECQAKAHDLLRAVGRDLVFLQQGYIPLDETEFYLAAAKAVDHTAQHVKAVDPLTTGWDTRGALVNFYQANLRALERKVRITRIFVFQRQDLATAEVQKVLRSQFENGIDVRIAYRDELPSSHDGASWASDCSFDFALYDDRVATEVFRVPGRYHGRKTCRPEEVNKFHHLFDLIGHNAHCAVFDGDLIVPAGAALAKVA